MYQIRLDVSGRLRLHVTEDCTACGVDQALGFRPYQVRLAHVSDTSGWHMYQIRLDGTCIRYAWMAHVSDTPGWHMYQIRLDGTYIRYAWMY